MTRLQYRNLLALSLACALGLTACGGGSSNPLGNPVTVTNPLNTGGQKLSFAYFQRCIQPILIANLVSLQDPNRTNSCASGGCHDTVTGTGGALRLIGGAAAVNLASSADVIRASDMYKNFYSAQGAVVEGAPTQSRLLAKPLLLVQHGGSQVIASISDPNALPLVYWINHAMPEGQDEFGSAGSALFVNNDPVNGACKTQ
jgi:hypothetical protein